MRKLSRVYTVLIFLFLYAPILVLIVASFNTGKDITSFDGFTLHQYAELFKDRTLLPLLRNSVVIAVLSSLIATFLGTTAALGIHAMRQRTRRLVMSVTNIPLTNPEIVSGISLALLFVFIGAVLRLNSVLGFWTLLIAHVTFCLPYVILSVMPKISQMDPNLNEAALDLGCTPVQAFFKVIIHEIMPGIISGALIAFTMSIDDFIISYFTAGSGVSTLAMTIYSMTKKRVSPEINAISTLLFGAVLLLLIIINVRESRQERLRERARA